MNRVPDVRELVKPDPEAIEVFRRSSSDAEQPVLAVTVTAIVRRSDGWHFDAAVLFETEAPSWKLTGCVLRSVGGSQRLSLPMRVPHLTYMAILREARRLSEMGARRGK